MTIHQPTDEETRLQAYNFWQLRSGGHGFDKYDWLHAHNQITLDKNFDCVADYNLHEYKKLDAEKLDPLVCRYCGESSPVVTFDSKGHSISDFWGAKIISPDECDTCNSIFQKCEDVLGKWSLSFRKAMQTRGRGGKKQVKAGDFSSRADGVNVFQASLKVLSAEQRIQMLKALIKYGLAAMPNSHLNSFEKTKRWILSTDHSSNPEECKRLFVISSSVDCENGHWQEAISQVKVFLIKEEDEGNSGAMMLFRVKSLAFQVAIPLSTNSAFRHKTTMQPIPAFTNFDQNYGAPKRIGMTDIAGSSDIQFHMN